jgi:hypothetical protein
MDRVHEGIGFEFGDAVLHGMDGCFLVWSLRESHWRLAILQNSEIREDLILS